MDLDASLTTLNNYLHSTGAMLYVPKGSVLSTDTNLGYDLYVINDYLTQYDGYIEKCSSTEFRFRSARHTDTSKMISLIDIQLPKEILMIERLKDAIY